MTEDPADTLPDNPPAFPCKIKDPESLTTLQFPGMSLRDYLAAKAMQGDWAAQDGQDNGLFTDTMNEEGFLSCARRYYRMADAMLAVRDEATTQEGK